MKYNKRYIQELFYYVNRELFDSMLDMPYFHISDYKDNTWGWCEDYKNNQFISIDKNCNPIDFFNTFVHELIHVWQCQNNKAMDHKKEFKKWSLKAYEIFY